MENQNELHSLQPGDVIKPKFYLCNQWQYSPESIAKIKAKWQEEKAPGYRIESTGKETWYMDGSPVCYWYKATDLATGKPVEINTENLTMYAKETNQ